MAEDATVPRVASCEAYAAPVRRGRRRRRRGINCPARPARPRPGASRTARPHLRRGRRCRHICGADREGAGGARHRGHQHAKYGPRPAARGGRACRLHEGGRREAEERNQRDPRRRRDALVARLWRMVVPGGTLVCAGAAKRGGWLGILARLLVILFRSRVLHQRVVIYVASEAPRRSRRTSENLSKPTGCGRQSTGPIRWKRRARPCVTR